MSTGIELEGVIVSPVNWTHKAGSFPPRSPDTIPGLSNRAEILDLSGKLISVHIRR